MAEERTQSPTPRMRQAARENGVVPLSSELTSAVALLAGALCLAAVGGGLTTELARFTEWAFKNPLFFGNDQARRTPSIEVFLPIIQNLLLLLGGSAIAAILTHQIQARGVWNPGRIALDFSRLLPANRNTASRGLWNLFKTIVILMIASLLIRDRWHEFEQLSKLGALDACRQGASIVGRLTAILAMLVVGLGVVDYGFQYWRVERMLMQTPEAQREDLKAVEGDPLVRSQRRRLASAMRIDSPHLLNGASLVLEGRGDLVVVLKGGPPPKKVTIERIASGPSGRRLREHAVDRGLLVCSAPILARKLARRRPGAAALPSDLATELGKLWSTPDHTTI